MRRRSSTRYPATATAATTTWWEQNLLQNEGRGLLTRRRFRNCAPCAVRLGKASSVACTGAKLIGFHRREENRERVPEEGRSRVMQRNSSTSA